MSTPAQLLIVDDEPTMCSSLADIFSDEGFAVSTASDGDSAVNLCRDQNFDLILLDVRMPALQDTNFQSIRSAPRARVILMSAYGLEDLRQMARSDQALVPLAESADLEQVVATLLQHNCRTPTILNVPPRLVPILMEAAEKQGVRCRTEMSPQSLIQRFNSESRELILFGGELNPLNWPAGLWGVVGMPPSLAAVLVAEGEAEFRKISSSRAAVPAIAFLRKPLDLDRMLDMAAEVRTHRVPETAPGTV